MVKLIQLSTPLPSEDELLSLIEPGDVACIENVYTNEPVVLRRFISNPALYTLGVAKRVPTAVDITDDRATGWAHFQSKEYEGLYNGHFSDVYTNWLQSCVATDKLFKKKTKKKE